MLSDRTITAMCKSCCRNISTARIYVEPLSSLVIQPVIIRGDGFTSNSPITIQASVRSTREKISFESYGHYMTNSFGCFDLQETESLGGTYTGVSDMGLFWSMMKKGGSHSRLQLTDATVPLKYDFKVFHGHISEIFEAALPVHAVSIERLCVSDNIQRVPVKSGNIRGTLFTPMGKGPFPAIITMYGGVKRRQVVEDAAAFLSNFGFVTLALAYFGVDDLPKNYTDQPYQIEYFKEAVNYLVKNEIVRKHMIGVYGASNGGSIAYGMMAHLPQVKAVVGINSCVSSIGSCTIYHGKRTESLGFNKDRIEYITDTLLNTINVMNDPNDEPDSVHMFEYSKADLLLIVGLDDANAKASYYADIARLKMDAVGKTNYEIMQYPGLGHLVDLPYMPQCSKEASALLPKGFMVVYGGNDRKLHSYQQVEVWKKVISFFIETLNSVTKSKL